MNKEVNVTFTARELVDTYRAVRSLMGQLETLMSDEAIRNYYQRLSDIHSKLIDATVQVASRNGEDGR